MLKSFLLFFVVLFSVDTFAQLSVDTSFNVSMRLVSPLQVTKNNDMVFKTTLVSSSQQSVSLSPNSTDSLEQPAEFEISGSAGATVSVSVTDSSITISYSGNDITVDTFNIGDGTNDGLSSLTLDSNGDATAYVGATATIPANSPEGNYTGSTTFRVTYQ